MGWVGKTPRGHQSYESGGKMTVCQNVFRPGMFSRFDLTILKPTIHCMSALFL